MPGLKENFWHSDLILLKSEQEGEGKRIFLLKGSTFNIYMDKHYACYFTNANRMNITVPDISRGLSQTKPNVFWDRWGIFINTGLGKWEI